MAIVIGATDVVARCLIYPQLFLGNIQANEKLWEFGKRAADGASHQSAVLRRLAPQASDVHRIGCKIAASGNARLFERIAPEQIPLEKKRYYCGYKEAVASNLQINGDEYRVELRSLPEFGEEAHVDVALFINENVPKNKQANLRTAVGVALALQFGTATPHICENDKDDTNHPIRRLGAGCLGSLPGPWQSMTVHLVDGRITSLTGDADGFSGVFDTRNLPEHCNSLNDQKTVPD
ncbi:MULTISPECIES: hypothetical protein [unclassified Sphingomonas]|uniref:hypothetical protein n=1 Tax=unclassified Sphingomonas TaxID=196159 RepID=UPI000A8AB1F2|nr:MULTISPECIES: hypothetical protein [unclassified Sphingomonas]